MTAEVSALGVPRCGDEPVEFCVPTWRWHDGWDGAAGCEIDGPYMPYPHRWDRPLRYAHLIYVLSHGFHDMTWKYTDTCDDPPVDELPTSLIVNCLPELDRAVRWGVV